MMRSVQRLVMSAGAATAVLALTGGCATIKDHRGYLGDKVLMDSVQAGIDNRTSVERTLGRPTFISLFGRKDWYYVSVSTKQAPFHRPKTYDETVMRVRFDADENVAMIERRGKEEISKIDPYGKETPTLGRDRSLLQDLFGNIGAVGAGGGPGGGGGGPGGGGGGNGPGTGPNGS
jgi:outer membrane protein assembly factor BamE (lipoprotein component of BamABCDE complex)